jgi:hypothetical protein
VEAAGDGFLAIGRSWCGVERVGERCALCVDVVTASERGGEERGLERGVARCQRACVVALDDLGEFAEREGAECVVTQPEDAQP